MVSPVHPTELLPLTPISNITSETGLHGLFWSYNVIIPTISIVGIAGNILSLVVLNFFNNKKFKGFLFAYMRLLAVVDTLHLLFTIQV